MSDTRRWAHPRARGRETMTEKNLMRDRAPDGHVGAKFVRDLRNDRHSLEAKVDELRLAEALDEERAPRRRKNHKRPYFRDGGKAWDRMVRHHEALSWETRAGQHRNPGGGGAFRGAL